MKRDEIAVFAMSGIPHMGRRSFYSCEATGQTGMLACTFGDCREGQISRSLLRCKFDAPPACCGAFDLRRGNGQGHAGLQDAEYLTSD